MKDDEKIFYDVWNKQSVFYRFISKFLCYKSLYKDWFEIGFTKGVEYTLKKNKGGLNKK